MEESDSEEEGWNGGLSMFPGLVSWNKSHYKEEMKDEEEEEQRVKLEISDDEEDIMVMANASGTKDLDLDRIDDITDEDEAEEVHITRESQVAQQKGDQKIEGVSDKTAGSTGGVLGIGLLCGYDDNNDDGDGDSDEGPPLEVKVVRPPETTSIHEIVGDGNDSGPPAEVKTLKSSISLGGDEDSDEGPPVEEKILKSPAKIGEPSPGDSDQKPATVSDRDSGGRHRKRKHQQQAGRTPPAVRPKVVRPDVFQRPIRPPTLLEKLLLDEIKRERNLVLQCVRYVCDKNFFLG